MQTFEQSIVEPTWAMPLIERILDHRNSMVPPEAIEGPKPPFRFVLYRKYKKYEMPYTGSSQDYRSQGLPPRWSEGRSFSSSGKEYEFESVNL